MAYTYFSSSISDTDKQLLATQAKKCRASILTMTTVAGSGHPGGSMSSIDILLTLYKYANISPSNYEKSNRDKILVSIGHISPGVYSCLAENAFFPIEDVLTEFRLAGGLYEGHIERGIPGVEWTTGNLGQGLSAACGVAYASKLKNEDSFVYVLMGDGEQQKGQISEAQRFATKFKLDNLIAIIDNNKLQISGNVGTVMPQDLAAEYRASGWEVLECNGHDFTELVATLHKAQKIAKPVLILAKTVMGKGISFMENQHKYHGSPISESDYVKAMGELGTEPQLDKYKALRKTRVAEILANKKAKHGKSLSYKINLPDIPAKIYAADASTDCRSAYGDALVAITATSMADGATPVVVFDCDVAPSTKTNGVEAKYPERFVQCGISEHNAASVAGAVGGYGVIPFFSAFAMFSIDEVYNQLRMIDINKSNIKVVSTHAGVDVGEDGRTHQCIDYLGLMRNVLGFQVITPADPNQTYRVVEYAARYYGCVNIVMGRSKLPVITNEKGEPYYGANYKFEYGKLEQIRGGSIPLVSFGGMLYKALEVREKVGSNLAIYNAPTPTHIDRNAILSLAKGGIIFTYEDHNPISGLYATICEIIANAGVACKVISFGVDQYSHSGNSDDVFKLIGLDPTDVAAKIKSLI